MGFCALSCDIESEEHYSYWPDMINIEKQLKSIDPGFVIGKSYLYTLDNVLIILEMNSDKEYGIHLFDKEKFTFLKSTGRRGQGPGEIIRFGRIGVNPVNRTFWVTDHGKQKIFLFPLDSVLTQPDYLPKISYDMRKDFFMSRFDFLNDSIILGKAVTVLSSNTYDMVTARQNIKTGFIEPFGYENPKITGKKANSLFKSSIEHEFYVNAYYYYDFISICNRDGTLRKNIYGPDRTENKNFIKTYYTEVDIAGSHIIAAYLGDRGIVEDEDGIQKGALPEKWLVFDQFGEYKFGMRSGHKIYSFCVDEENDRVITFFDDREPALAYFELPNDIE